MKKGKRHQTRISRISPDKRRRGQDTNAYRQMTIDYLATDFPGQKAPRARRREECKGKILRFMNYDLGIIAKFMSSLKDIFPDCPGFLRLSQRLAPASGGDGRVTT